jgi:bacterial/archaeal transporter family-2 protein
MFSESRFFVALVALAGGVALAVQIGFNANLRKFLEHPLHATVVSFAVGTVAALTMSIVLRTPLPIGEKLASSSFWMWLGGCMGAFYVFTTIYSGPRIGAALAVSLVIFGQLLASIAIDHFGWFGFPQSSVSPLKLAGAALVLGGVSLIAYAKGA